MRLAPSGDHTGSIWSAGPWLTLVSAAVAQSARQMSYLPVRASSRANATSVSVGEREILRWTPVSPSFCRRVPLRSNQVSRSAPRRDRYTRTPVSDAEKSARKGSSNARLYTSATGNSAPVNFSAPASKDLANRVASCAYNRYPPPDLPFAYTAFDKT